jgi:3-phytase
VLAGLVAPPAFAHHGHDRDRTIRFATFNASLNRNHAGDLIAAMQSGTDPQIQNVAEIIQRARPDVLNINELDFVPDAQALELFQRNYLSVSQHGAKPIFYPFRFVAESNTGISSGKDLNNNGAVVTTPEAPGYGDDSFGFGAFPGQFGLGVLSRYPIDRRHARTFQKFLWKDMPNALLPDDPNTAAPNDWYSPDELAIFRLSSKSHWDLPLWVGRGAPIHFLVSHPTPPVFDGAEDRNGTRNHDEIRFWADYVTPGAGRYIYDDEGSRGGLKGEHFVIAGDQNADPFDGDSTQNAIQQFLNNAQINTSNTPTSPGGPEQAALQGGANATHEGDPKFDTADFLDTPGPGNLRADYVLPDRGTRIKNSFVYWPLSSDPLFAPVGVFQGLPNGNGFPSSDHRLVAIDIGVTESHGHH